MKKGSDKHCRMKFYLKEETQYVSITYCGQKVLRIREKEEAGAPFSR